VKVLVDVSSKLKHSDKPCGHPIDLRSVQKKMEKRYTSKVQFARDMEYLWKFWEEHEISAVPDVSDKAATLKNIFKGLWKQYLGDSLPSGWKSKDRSYSTLSLPSGQIRPPTRDDDGARCTRSVRENSKSELKNILANLNGYRLKDRHPSTFDGDLRRSTTKQRHKPSSSPCKLSARSSCIFEPAGRARRQRARNKKREIVAGHGEIEKVQNAAGNMGRQIQHLTTETTLADPAMSEFSEFDTSSASESRELHQDIEDHFLVEAESSIEAVRKGKIGKPEQWWDLHDDYEWVVSVPSPKMRSSENFARHNGDVQQNKFSLVVSTAAPRGILKNPIVKGIPWWEDFGPSRRIIETNEKTEGTRDPSELGFAPDTSDSRLGVVRKSELSRNAWEKRIKRAILKPPPGCLPGNHVRAEGPWGAAEFSCLQALSNDGKCSPVLQYTRPLRQGRLNPVWTQDPGSVKDRLKTVESVKRERDRAAIASPTTSQSKSSTLELVREKDCWLGVKRGSICKICSAPATRFCSLCKFVHYCSLECQLMNVSDHFPICARMVLGKGFKKTKKKEQTVGSWSEDNYRSNKRKTLSERNFFKDCEDESRLLERNLAKSTGVDGNCERTEVYPPALQEGRRSQKLTNTGFNQEMNSNWSKQRAHRFSPLRADKKYVPSDGRVEQLRKTISSHRGLSQGPIKRGKKRQMFGGVSQNFAHRGFPGHNSSKRCWVAPSSHARHSISTKNPVSYRMDERGSSNSRVGRMPGVEKLKFSRNAHIVDMHECVREEGHPEFENVRSAYEENRNRFPQRLCREGSRDRCLPGLPPAPYSSSVGRRRQRASKQSHYVRYPDREAQTHFGGLRSNESHRNMYSASSVPRASKAYYEGHSRSFPISRPPRKHLQPSAVNGIPMQGGLIRHLDDRNQSLNSVANILGPRVRSTGHRNGVGLINLKSNRIREVSITGRKRRRSAKNHSLSARRRANKGARHKFPKLVRLQTGVDEPKCTIMPAPALADSKSPSTRSFTGGIADPVPCHGRRGESFEANSEKKAEAKLFSSNPAKSPTTVKLSGSIRSNAVNVPMGTAANLDKTQNIITKREHQNAKPDFYPSPPAPVAQALPLPPYQQFLFYMARRMDSRL